eukprot:COSAG02_NODE_1578_length_11853_cov_3.734048_11_plen_92_part_00
MIETDGPYGGALCNSHNHTHHRGLLDSQYWQMRLQAEQYHKMRRLGVFVNAPDVRRINTVPNRALASADDLRVYYFLDSDARYISSTAAIR